mgnify:FL=1
MRKHFIQQITNRARTDKRVFLLIGDLGYSVVEDFEREFPSRFANVGVSEQAGMGIAAGLAKSHLPVFYSIANFPSFRCLEQIRNDVAHEGNPVMIVSLGAGFSYGTAGYSHHAIEDAAAVGSIFGMSVYTPACIHELDDVLEAHWKNPRPIYLRLGSGEVCDECLPGSRNFQSRVNLDKTDFKPSTLFVTHGEIGKLVARSLEQSGLPYEQLSVADFNLSSRAELDFVASFRNVVTVEEHSGEFGFGARIRSKLSNTNFHRFEIMGVPDMDFHIGGKRQFHLERSGLSESDFLNQLEKLYNA